MHAVSMQGVQLSHVRSSLSAYILYWITIRFLVLGRPVFVVSRVWMGPNVALPIFIFLFVGSWSSNFKDLNSVPVRSCCFISCAGIPVLFYPYTPPPFHSLLFSPATFPPATTERMNTNTNALLLNDYNCYYAERSGAEVVTPHRNEKVNTCQGELRRVK